MLSALAVPAGALLDLAFGDPPGMPHIVRLMGWLISRLESFFRGVFPKTPAGEKAAGAAMAFLTASLCFAAPFFILRALSRISPMLSLALESFLCFQTLAARSLWSESMKVRKSLAEGCLATARKNVALIVGRDASLLDEAGIARAAVETVAENASDGVAAPLFFMALGGAPLACLYKAVNTMDSMVGYKNERYLHFGFIPAKLDDLLNLAPSRATALSLAAGALLLGYDGKNALRIWRRDRKRHSSPNAGNPEAAMAGALGLRLGGPSSYFGRIVQKPFIGDALRQISNEDIARANKIMAVSSALATAVAAGLRLLALFLMAGPAS